MSYVSIYSFLECVARGVAWVTYKNVRPRKGRRKYKVAIGTTFIFSPVEQNWCFYGTFSNN